MNEELDLSSINEAYPLDIPLNQNKPISNLFLYVILKYSKFSKDSKINTFNF